MIYSDLAIAAVLIAVMVDLFVFKNSLLQHFGSRIQSFSPSS